MPDREKVINALEVVRKGYVYKKNGQNVISLDVRFVDMVLAMLKEQEAKTGHWISTGFGHGKCSECGFSVGNIHESKYCPHCGSRMEGR